MELVLPVVSALSITSPIILTWAVGIIIALIRWQQHPRVSLLVVIALGLLIITGVISTSVNVLLPRMLLEAGESTSTVGIAFAVTGAVFSLIQTVCWALILVALFGKRDTQKPNHV